MLAHLHLDRRHARPEHPHHWVRDAVLAAHVGVAAIVVVTALERAGDEPAPVSASSPTEQVAPAPDPAASVAVVPTSDSGSAVAADTAVGPSAAAVPGTIQISLVHGGATAPAVDAINGVLLGQLRVEVIDASGTAQAAMVVAIGEVGRIEGLAAGDYRLVLRQETPVTEPAAGVAISAASAQVTQAITVAEGDVLLVAAQPGA